MTDNSSRPSMSRWRVVTPPTVPQAEADKKRLRFMPRTICSADLLDDLVRQWTLTAESMGGVICEPSIETVRVMWLDQGGIVSVDRRIYELTLGQGLLFTIAAEDVACYLGWIRSHERERAPEAVIGQQCRTLPTMHAGVCLTLAQFAELRAVLGTIEQEAAAFESAEHEAFNEKMAKAGPHLDVPLRRTVRKGDA